MQALCGLQVLFYLFNCQTPGFLICDTNGNRIGSYTTGEVYEMILADTFHLYDESDTQDHLLNDLSDLLDFE